MPGLWPLFAKAARIDQPLDPLAHRELAVEVLPLDRLRTAHLTGELASSVNAFDFLFPAQARLSPLFGRGQPNIGTYLRSPDGQLPCNDEGVRRVSPCKSGMAVL